MAAEAQAGGDAGARPSGSTRPEAADPGPVAERRMVTVMFADLVGFTTLAEGLDAEAVRELLTRYFEIARDVIDRYGGNVEKFIGDAVMAVWGAPVAHEDDAERAVRAALELLDAVGDLGPGIQIRAGVLTGEAAVTLGAVGQGMVAGDLVNTASRLQSVATPGTVLVGDATQRATADAIAFEPAGEHVLKGKELPVTAWVAKRVVSKRKGMGRSDRLEAPFVGRDPELRLLKDLFHATTREQRARLVSITGQGGIGKSRLAWEFLKYIDGVVEGVWWHDGRSPAYGEGVTFWALGEMIRSRAGLLETDDAATTRAKVAEMVAEHVPAEEERRWIEPSLLALLGVGEAPSGGRDELFRAWRTFFERLASTGIVTLLFEDLQWADAGLLDFIDHLLEWSRGVPILIITLARPELLERRPGWGAGRRQFLALDLEPLTEAAMHDLLAGLAPGLPATAVRSIIARADGIPLYAVETIRMLVSEGRLIEADGRYDPVGDLGELAVPESLHALIAARLDGLDASVRALLQDAAILGQSFTLQGLSAVCGEDQEALADRLRDLARAELIIEDVDPRSPERGMFAFVQALIREVAYSTLSKRDRRSRHLAAARFYESLGDDELAGALAAHYFAAWEATPDGPEGDAIAIQARLALIAAADRAVSLGSPEGAVSFLDQALAVTSEPRDRAVILEKAGRAASYALHTDQAEAFLTEAIGLRRSLGDVPGRLATVAVLSDTLLSAQRMGEAATLLEAEIADADGAADESDLAVVLINLARSYFVRDRIAEGLAAVDRALPVVEDRELYEPLLEALIIKGNLLARVGRPIEGLALVEAARRLAIERQMPSWESRAVMVISLSLAIRDPRAAFELEKEGIELARIIGRHDLEWLLIGNGGEDAIRTGDWDWQAGEYKKFADLDIDPTIEYQMRVATIAIEVLRGTIETTEARRVAATMSSMERGDLSSNGPLLLGWLAFAEGRFDVAASAWLETASSSRLNAPFVLPRVAHAALLAKDGELARTALERLSEVGARGRAIEVDRTAIDAGLAALSGETGKAVSGYRLAITGWRDLGLVWDEALTSLVFVSLVGPADPQAQAAADSAREILERLGAARVIDLLDAAIERWRIPQATEVDPVETAAGSDASQVLESLG
jgi:class 3 adenylate cyclase/tetratricopeptide (TPR) repeat protein